LIVGDFNGDGKPDIAVLLGGGGCPADAQGSVAIFLGSGDGTFQQPVVSAVIYVPNSLVAADLNGDGKLDIAITGYANCVGGGSGTAAMAVLLGNGDGTFQPYAELPAAYGPIGGLLVAGDFNGDGIVDLAAQSGSGQANSALTFLGNGDGTFRPPQASTIGYQPVVFAAADVNGDGKLDLIVPNLCGNVSGCDNSQPSPSSVSVLLGNGDGTFQPNVEYPVGIYATSVAIGDFNGDGKLDLAVGTQCGSDFRCDDFGIDALSLLLGNGDGTFQPQVTPALLGEFNGIFSLAAGDFNSDGLLDLVMGDGVHVDLQSTLLLPTTSLTFGNQTVGTGSQPQALTLSNVSTKVPITISSAQVTGTNASDFSVKTACSKLWAKSACKVNVTFKPTAPGTRTATVVVTDSAVGSPHQITVTGTGRHRK
jgi:FG-GAP-like repeat/Abnormal spindle-like microcephaly-assoc'd, ASPM-SPD-2-Hydin